LFALGASPINETSGVAPSDDGIELSIVLAEADPVGGFVGEFVSQPLLQAGLLVGVGGYLIYLQPLLAILVAVVFFPQLGFVPLMQAAINRRVAAKVSASRDVSRAIVDPKIGGDIESQVRRVSFLFDTNMSIYRIKFVMNFLMNLMTQLGYAAIFALGGYYVVTGKTEIGTIVAFTSGLTKINDPWGSLVDWYRNLKATEVKYQMIRDACLGEQNSRAT
ncbi:MAG: ABC transporter ATP-binding protein, partial [Rhizobiaceae bacterium]|nr:ABC transporter ATP-binding protein [Rhizobiaceae bacterium]